MSFAGDAARIFGEVVSEELLREMVDEGIHFCAEMMSKNDAQHGEIPLKDVKAVKVEVRDGFNARRRVSLRVQGRRDLPLTRVGEPLPLAQLEQDGAELARFLGVNLEGL